MEKKKTASGQLQLTSEDVFFKDPTGKRLELGMDNQKDSVGNEFISV